MSTKNYMNLIALFVLTFSYAQNMQKGFTYLETGKNKEAVSFFKKILKNYPDNKTAQLCYGRAMGLSGNSKTAISIFSDLLKAYPNDFEIKLNYAESLLWNNDFNKAKNYYEHLLKENNQSFPALLGYANTLSNLKKYEDALMYVNKALTVSPGNPNALTSKKYIYLGYAYKKQQTQAYDKAETLLKESLTFFENDKDTLLNLANLYLIMGKQDKATETYRTIAQNPDYSIFALNGLSLISHLKGKEKEALKLSEEAYQLIANIKNNTLLQQTTERYIQALIWNKKYSNAKALIDNLASKQPNENWILALRATLNIYKSDFKKSLTDYNSILKNDSTSFDGNLGKANALKALGRYDAAYSAANNTLRFYKNQKDATQFIETLNTTFTPFLETKISYSFNNGDNEAYTFQTNVEIPTSTQFKWLAGYNYRSTSNSVINTKATLNTMVLGVGYRVLPNVAFKGTTGIVSTKSDTKDFKQFLTDVSLQVKPFKLQVLDVGYKREIQNFNAELLDRDIVMNNFYANYSLSTNFNLGWFTQYYFTKQNDNNVRSLLFTSLYYNIIGKPSLKAGLNYQYITFKNQLPAIYFSPERFNAGEVFVNLIKDESIAKPNTWYYELTAATGYQFIENNDGQSTYRIQATLGYKCSGRSLLNFYGTRSNIASATAAGFTFTEIGIRFKWYLGGKPAFRK